MTTKFFGSLRQKFKSLKSFKKPLAALGILGAIALTSACSSADASARTENGRTVLRYQGSVGQVTYPELAEYLGYYEKVKLEWISNVTGGPESIQATATGQTEFGGAFNGAISKLQSTGAEVTSVISYYGSDLKTNGGYYTLEGSPIKDAKDLIGKKIGVNTLGAQAEFIVKEYLRRGGLSDAEIDKVELVVVPPVNAEQTLREGQIDVAGLSSVLQDKALERGGITRLFGETDLYGEFSYGSLIFKDSFIKSNPEAVEDFVQGTARAIRWAQLNVAEVQKAFNEIIEKRDRQEDTTLTQYWKSTGIAGIGGVIDEKEISTWLDYLEGTGELKKGQLKTKDLYTNEYNPYANGKLQPDELEYKK